MNALEVLKKIRAVDWINRPVRTALRSLVKGERVLQDKIIARWPVSGVFDVDVSGVDVRLYGQCDDGLGNHLFYGRNVESTELHVWKLLAREANVVLDVGAHTGVYSIVAARANPKARIYAFEPHPKNHERLLKNLTLNGASQVHPEAAALGDRDGTISFTIPSNGSISLVSSAVGSFSRGHFGIEYTDVQVRQHALDGFVERAGLPSVDLVKVDVEYYEAQVLRGARGVLDRWSPALLMEVFNYDVFTGDKPELSSKLSPASVLEVEELLKNAGYHAYALGKRGLLRVSNLRSIPDGGSNYLFSKTELASRYTPYRDEASILRLLPRRAGSRAD